MNMNEAMAALSAAAAALADVQEVLNEIQYQAADRGDPEERLKEIRNQLSRLGL